MVMDRRRQRLRDNTSRVGGALNGTVNEYRLNLEDEQPDASNVLDVLKESTVQRENRINEEFGKKRAVKFYLSLHVNFHPSTDVAVLSTDIIGVYESCDVHDALNSSYENLVSSIEDFQQRGSGWILDKLMALDLHLPEFDPLRATSYSPLPTCIPNRKAVVNIKNKDEKCFRWSVIAGLYGDSHAENHERLSHYMGYEKEFNLQFLMALKDIPKLERLSNVSVSVYAWDQEGYIPPLIVSKEVNKRHGNLHLTAADDTNHYCFIKDFSKLVGSQYSNGNYKTYFCRFCLHGFSSHSATRVKAQHRRTNEDVEKRLKEYEEHCFAFAAQRTEFPDDLILKFENIQKQVQAPFTVYADFESILKQLSAKCQEHIACSYAYQIAYSLHWNLLSKKGIYCYDYMDSTVILDGVLTPNR